MNGLAITAGSNPIFFASIGRVEPTIFATITVSSKVKFTTKATPKPTLSNTISFAKFTNAKVNPHNIATLDSFHKTFYLNITMES